MNKTGIDNIINESIKKVVPFFSSSDKKSLKESIQLDIQQGNINSEDLTTEKLTGILNKELHNATLKSIWKNFPYIEKKGKLI